MADDDVAPVPRPKKERVLREDFDEAGKPVNRFVTPLETLVQQAKKREAEAALTAIGQPNEKQIEEAQELA